MKKLILSLFMLLPLLTWADDSGTTGGCTYNYVASTGTLTITGSSNMGNYSSNSAQPWYSYASSIKKIVINSGVKSIGERAFSGCSALTNVTIPLSVTAIKSYAFSGCSTLSSVAIPITVTVISARAFEGCSNLTSVTIPNGITTIGAYAFSNCSRLTSVNIPNSVTSIGRFSFEGCKGLTSLTIPNSITYIEDGVFFGCSGLTRVTIPNSVTSIGRIAFGYCTSLTSIGSVGSGSSIELPNSITAISSSCFQGCSGLTSIEIPKSVSLIDVYAFQGCSGLTSVKAYSPASLEEDAFDYLPNCILHIPCGTSSNFEFGWNSYFRKNNCIEDFIFFKDANVESLCLTNWDTDNNGEIGPDEAAAVTDLGTVFNGNTTISSFTELQFFTGLSGIGNHAFYGCHGLTSINLPSNINAIGNFAFAECNNLKSITIPNTVQTIGESAFYDCNELKSITLSNSLKSIGKWAFQDCFNLTAITIPSNVEAIGEGPFLNCYSLSSIKVNSSNLFYNDGDGNNCIIENASNSVIAGCRSSVIPDEVTSIAPSAFYGCTYLESIAIPENVTSIGDLAFAHCGKLKTVIMQNTNIVDYTNQFYINDIYYIGSQYYNSTPYITPNRTLYVPAGTRDDYISAGWTEDVFKGGVIEYEELPFVKFKDFTVKSLCVANWDTNSDGEISYDEAAAVTDLSTVFYNNPSITSFNELQYFSGLTGIANSAFSGCSKLLSITIPENVKTIGNNAFSNCKGLSSFDIPQGAISIGNLAFSYCTGLTSINIPNSIISIGNAAFSDCTGLTSIDIPNSITLIDAYAFQKCSSLTFIKIPASVTSIGYNAFSSCNQIKKVIVSDIASWSQIAFGSSYANPLFYAKHLYSDDNTEITDLIIPESVTSIGAYAFYNGIALSSVIIPESVASINTDAFRGCSNLTKVKVGNSSPVSLSNYTFSNRTNAILIVPQGARDAYEAADYWKDFKAIQYEEDLLNSFEMSDLRVEHGAWLQLPVRMINQEQITAAEFDLTIPESFSLLGCTLTERKSDHDISFSQLDDGLYHVTIFSLSSSAFKENEGELVNLLLLADAVGAHSVALKNIELSTKDGSKRNPPDISASVTICDIPIGDVNGDGDVTISDAVAIVNHRLGRTPARFVRAAADVNGDSEITITDAVRIVNMILSAEAGAKPRAQSFELSHEPQ